MANAGIKYTRECNDDLASELLVIIRSAWEPVFSLQPADPKFLERVMVQRK
jgi:hypothetical protein